MCCGNENYEKRCAAEHLVNMIPQRNVGLVSGVRSEHLRWFLGLTKEELDKLVRKTNNGPHGGGQEIF
jgi:hypothetical protein